MRKDEAVMELIKLLSNPVRVQVMQYLQNYGEATTKQISEALTGIPAPTLYRHINLLLKEEVLLIKEERKVRGSLERLLVINDAKITEAGNGNGMMMATTIVWCMKVAIVMESDGVKVTRMI